MPGGITISLVANAFKSENYQTGKIKNNLESRNVLRSNRSFIYIEYL